MRKPVLILSVALIASTTTATWLWQQLREERSRNTEMSAHMAKSGHDTSAVAFSSPEGSSSGALAPSVTSDSQASTPVIAAQGSRTVHGTEDEWDRHQRQLFQDPKFRDARRVELRLQHAVRRDDAIRLLGFTPGEADALIEAMVERHIRALMKATPDVDLSIEGRRRAKEQVEAEEREHQDELRVLLGEQKRARWHDYMESLATRARVDGFRIRLTGEDALRDDQVEPLIAALHTERAQLRRELTEYQDSLDWSNESLNGGSQRWELFAARQLELLGEAKQRSLTAAGAILSPSQLQRLAALLQQEIDREQASNQTIQVRSRIDAGTRPD